MLRSIKTLLGYTVLAEDGDMGKVRDFCFHDDTWIIRYLVVDTGHWLPGRRVLVTPGALGKPNWEGLNFPVALTREQVEKSPDIDTDKPVSRQQEVALFKHYGWPFYWIGVEPGPSTWPPFVPVAPLPVPLKASPTENEEKADPHLRSFREVKGYRTPRQRWRDGACAGLHSRGFALGHPLRGRPDQQLAAGKEGLDFSAVAGRNPSPGKEGGRDANPGKHPPLPRVQSASVRQS